MNLKIFIFILLASFSAFSFSCSNSKAASEDRKEVVFDDGHKNPSGDRVAADDQNPDSKNPQVSTSTKNSEEINKIIADNSEVTTRYDGYGNKTETRHFKNHPRLSLVLLRTAADGRQQVYVYGYGKEVKTLPDEMITKALTASGDEIANGAGLYETRSNTEIKNFRKQAAPIQTLPSSRFPIQKPQNIPTQTEVNEQNTQPKVEEDSPNPSDGEEDVMKNRQSEEESQK